jgi:hypothetical protein
MGVCKELPKSVVKKTPIDGKKIHTTKLLDQGGRPFGVKRLSDDGHSYQIEFSEGILIHKRKSLLTCGRSWKNLHSENIAIRRIDYLYQIRLFHQMPLKVTLDPFH